MEEGKIRRRVHRQLPCIPSISATATAHQHKPTFSIINDPKAVESTRDTWVGCNNSNNNSSCRSPCSNDAAIFCASLQHSLKGSRCETTTTCIAKTLYAFGKDVAHAVESYNNTIATQGQQSTTTADCDMVCDPFDEYNSMRPWEESSNDDINTSNSTNNIRSEWAFTTTCHKEGRELLLQSSPLLISIKSCLSEIIETVAHCMKSYKYISSIQRQGCWVLKGLVLARFPCVTLLSTLLGTSWILSILELSRWTATFGLQLLYFICKCEPALASGKDVQDVFHKVMLVRNKFNRDAQVQQWALMTSFVVLSSLGCEPMVDQAYSQIEHVLATIATFKNDIHVVGAACMMLETVLRKKTTRTELVCRIVDALLDIMETHAQHAHTIAHCCRTLDTIFLHQSFFRHYALYKRLVQNIITVMEAHATSLVIQVHCISLMALFLLSILARSVLYHHGIASLVIRALEQFPTDVTLIRLGGIILQSLFLSRDSERRAIVSAGGIEFAVHLAESPSQTYSINFILEHLGKKSLLAPTLSLDVQAHLRRLVKYSNTPSLLQGVHLHPLVSLMDSDQFL
eukprot:m.128678 g.128678  ORF g.128678 m.128678 type:complete len:571 (+) comp9453_c1_seq2:206-1918(+)